ncbi:MAG: hypothetical protein DME88_10975 [Verrucomicrobia bacterium]|nr:MAG: hypothetical protein DME88_10975 [Verrucomicrobiota bacterium]
MRLQSRSFARWNQSLRRSADSIGLTEIVSDYSLLTRQLLLFRSTNGNKGTKTRRNSEVYIEAIAHIFP